MSKSLDDLFKEVYAPVLRNQLEIQRQWIAKALSEYESHMTLSQKIAREVDRVYEATLCQEEGPSVGYSDDYGDYYNVTCERKIGHKGKHKEYSDSITLSW